MTGYKVPRNGKAGVAFAGVSLAEASPLLVSFFIGLALGSFIGWKGYVGAPVLGYFITKAYLEWKKGRLPGHLAVSLYKTGLVPFSKAFDKPKKIFVGNSTVINPASSKLIDAALKAQQRQAVADAIKTVERERVEAENKVVRELADTAA